MDFEPGSFDFDVPSARDHAQLAEHLAQLRQDQALRIDRPVYSFKIHAPLKRRQRVAPTEVDRPRARHVLHDPAGVRDGFSRAWVFSRSRTDDVRFIRRLLRDTRERGRSVKSVTDQYLATTVKLAHVPFFVQPASDQVDRC